MWNPHSHYKLVSEAAYMETNNKSPTSIMVSPRIDSAMTHVPTLSAKVRRNSSQNEQLWQTLDIDNVFGPNLGFKNS